MINFDLKKIKCIFFDFDSTLYTGADWSGHEEYMYNLFIDIGEFKTIDEAEVTLKNLYPEEKDYTRRVAYYINDNSRILKEYMQRRDDEIYDTSSKDIKAVSNSLLTKLAKKYKLYIVSDSPQKYLYHYLKKYGIDANNFKLVLANRYDEGDLTKIYIMKEAMEDSKFSAENILMIGDSLEWDKKPAEKLGINFCLTSSVKETEEIIKELLK